MAEAGRILIVEDDHFLSVLLKARLEKEGFTIAQAFDGQEALIALPAFKPNLILLDLIMPKLSGFEFLEKMSVDPSFQKIPVMVLSNLGQQADISKAQQFGVIAYFVKAAMSIDDVVKRVKDTLVTSSIPS